MKLLLPAYLVLLSTVSLAQGQATYTVKPGVGILEVVPIKEIYLYPVFVNGTVTFKDRRTVAGNLNYNLLIKQIQFIDAKGDTLSLADENTIKHIVITTDTFYYNNTICVKQIASRPSFKLAEMEYYKEFIQKPGSYGLSSAATASHSISNVVVQGKGYQLNTDQEVVLVKAKEYFFGNKYNEFVFADKKNLLKLFPKHRKTIEDYLDSNVIEFNKKEDLMKLAILLEKL